MFCAGFPSGGKDACYGDSGGPIFEVRDGQPVQVGVISSGYGCARPDFSGVYSRVSGAYDWIQDTMKKLNQGDTSGCGGGSSVLGYSSRCIGQLHYGFRIKTIRRYIWDIK